MLPPNDGYPGRPRLGLGRRRVDRTLREGQRLTHAAHVGMQCKVEFAGTPSTRSRNGSIGKILSLRICMERFLSMGAWDVGTEEDGELVP
jgi:hypothetical protein